MTKESKTVSLAILTVFAYAMVSFFDHYVLLFPFPLNSAIFFIVALYFAYLNGSKNPFLSVLTSLIGLLSMFSSEFYWNMLLGANEMNDFSESLTTDFIKICYYIGLICWIVVTFRKNSAVSIQFLGILSIILVGVGAVFNNPYIELSGIFIPFIYSIRFKTESEFLKLWILLFVLELTKVWSLASLV
jgi:hypothetical protein